MHRVYTQFGLVKDKGRTTGYHYVRQRDIGSYHIRRIYSFIRKNGDPVFMAGKELDSNFLIFLPQVFTNDPVSDIELGSRNSCYAGERLCFFLIAQFRGRNREDANFQAWKKRLLRVCMSVSVSSIDLMSRKDDAHTGGLITCWPINSSKVRGKDADLRKKVSFIFNWLSNHFLDVSCLP